MCVSATLLAGLGGLAASKMLAPKTPSVTQTSPKADQAAADAQAAAMAAQDKTRRRRAVRASSLLAGDNDLASPVTGMPSAAGKPTLGG